MQYFAHIVSRRNITRSKVYEADVRRWLYAFIFMHQQIVAFAILCCIKITSAANVVSPEPQQIAI